MTERCCATCADRMVPPEVERCRLCCSAPPERGRIVYPGWRPANLCGTCADYSTSTEQYPCVACVYHSLWSALKAAAVEEPEKQPAISFAQVFHRALTPTELLLVYKNTRAGKFSCTSCLSPTDERGLCAACAKPPLVPPSPPAMCAHCGVQPRLPLERCKGRVVANVLCGDCFTERHSDSGPHRLPVEDRSGERIVDDLRRFIARPCGRPK